MRSRSKPYIKKKETLTFWFPNTGHHVCIHEAGKERTMRLWPYYLLAIMQVQGLALHLPTTLGRRSHRKSFSWNMEVELVMQSQDIQFKSWSYGFHPLQQCCKTLLHQEKREFSIICLTLWLRQKKMRILKCFISYLHKFI